MIRRTMEFQNEQELVAAEQAVALVRRPKALADATPDGEVLAAVEGTTVVRGRRFVRDRLQDVLNSQDERLEQKGGRGWDCPCGGSRRSHSPAQRRLDTAAGDVTLHRGYFICRRCGLHAHPLDERLGVDGFVSPHAQRLVCPLGAEHSFERSARLLREVAGLRLWDNTVRRICDEHGGRIRTWQREDPEAARPFRQAEGYVEFQADGTCVNPFGGWREVRLSIFAKRRRGDAVTDPDDRDASDAGPAPARRRRGDPHQHDPGPTVATGGGEARAEGDGRVDGPGRWGEVDLERDREEPARSDRGAGRLRCRRAPPRRGGGTLRGGPGGRGVVRGPTSDPTEDRRRTLLEFGSSGLREALVSEPGEVSERVGYLVSHAVHTAYRQRLAEGRSIGSGMVEGACKMAIGRRLKQTGARWKMCRLERMAALCWLTDRPIRGGLEASGWIAI